MPTSFTNNLTDQQEAFRAWAEAHGTYTMTASGGWVNVNHDTLRFYGPDTLIRPEPIPEVEAVENEADPGMREVIRDFQGREVKALKQFIETGVYGTGWQYSRGKLFIFGYDWGEGDILFRLDDHAITAIENRVKHLLPLLQRLAAREGLQLKFQQQLTRPRDTTPIAFWRWRNGEEVDDTKLLVTQPTYVISESDDVDEDDDCDEDW